jgi:hypothetical protein
MYREDVGNGITFVHMLYIWIYLRLDWFFFTDYPIKNHDITNPSSTFYFITPQFPTLLLVWIF